MKRLRRYLPFTTFSGATWFAVRHRRPIWDWGTWTLRSVPRLLDDERGDVLREAKLRIRLQSEDRLAGDHIEVEVAAGTATLRGEVERGHRSVVTELVQSEKGIESIQDDLRERRDGRRGRRKAA